MLSSPFWYFFILFPKIKSQDLTSRKRLFKVQTKLLVAVVSQHKLSAGSVAKYILNKLDDLLMQNWKLKLKICENRTDESIN